MSSELKAPIFLVREGFRADGFVGGARFHLTVEQYSSACRVRLSVLFVCRFTGSPDLLLIPIVPHVRSGDAGAHGCPESKGNLLLPRRLMRGQTSHRLSGRRVPTLADHTVELAWLRKKQLRGPAGTGSECGEEEFNGKSRSDHSFEDVQRFPVSFGWDRHETL